MLGAMWLLATPIVIFRAHGTVMNGAEEISADRRSDVFLPRPNTLVRVVRVGGGKDTSTWAGSKRHGTCEKPSEGPSPSGAPGTLRDSFDDKKVPGDFDILTSGRRRLRVDDEFERNHIRKIGKVAKAIT